MTSSPPRSAAYFDDWYANMVGSPAKDEILQRHLGLPPHVLSTSMLPWDGVAVVTEALRLSPAAVLLDLACGRGGYGLEIARRGGARLIGVDFSAEAIRQAREHAERLGRQATFEVGSLTATGLPDASVDAIMCVDAVQFAEPQQDAYREFHRVLRPAGRIALTCWEPRDGSARRDERVPARLRTVDLRAGLVAAGFADVEVQDRPDWLALEGAMWAEAGALDPGDDAALRSFRDEGVRTKEFRHLIRRVLATATAA